MPYNQNDFSNTWGGRKEINMVRQLSDYRGSYWFAETYFPVDANGNRYITEGLIVAVAKVATNATYGDTFMAVPWNAAASYGAGSDHAVGILDVRLNATMQAEAVSLKYHGQLQKRNIYYLGGQRGDIPAAVKTQLPDIDWV